MPKRTRTRSHRQRYSLKPAVVYLRVSSKKQSDFVKGHTSFNVQKQECLDYANDNEYSVKKLVKETRSARYLYKQRGLLNIIAKNENITLIVYNVSRLSRNTKEALFLLDKMEEKNITLVSATENLNLNTSSGRHSFRTLLSSAELESDTIGDRVRRSIEYRRSIGSYIGRAPYGHTTINKKKYCKDNDGNIKIRKLVPDQYELDVIKFVNMAIGGYISSKRLSEQMYKLVSDKKDKVPILFEEHGRKIKTISYDMLSCRDIADLLNSYNVTKRGKRWSTNSVRHVSKLYNKMQTEMDDMELDDVVQSMSDVEIDTDCETSDYDSEFEEILMDDIDNPLKKMKF